MLVYYIVVYLLVVYYLSTSGLHASVYTGLNVQKLVGKVRLGWMGLIDWVGNL